MRTRFSSARSSEVKPDTFRKLTPEERAWLLLMESLTPKQQETFVNAGYIDVRPKRHRSLNIFKRRRTYRIIDYACAVRVQHYCVHIRQGRFPIPDHFLTFKTWIECDERGFLQEANWLGKRLYY